jgi:hypothetical protein
MKMTLICNKNKCYYCKRHFKQWKSIVKKKYLHEFPECWANVQDEIFLKSEWWDEFCFEWSEFFGYNDTTRVAYDKKMITMFPFYFSKNKPCSFFDENWDDFVKAYSDYFRIKIN